MVCTLQITPRKTSSHIARACPGAASTAKIRAHPAPAPPLSLAPGRTPLCRGAAHRRWMASSQYIIKQHVKCRVIWLRTVAERGVGRQLQRCTPPRRFLSLTHVPFMLLVPPGGEVSLDGMGGEGNAQEHQVQHNVSDDDHRAMQGRVVLTRRVQPLQNPRVAMYLQQEGEGAKHSNKLNGTRGVACPTNAPSLYAGWDLPPRPTPPLLLLSQPPPLCTP